MFLCTGNSCRSQIAEGWARKLWGERYEFFSAGTHKHGMNARAIKVMKDAGVDISSHFSKTIEELPAVTFDYVITVCDNAKETCPYFPAGKIVHIGFEDPPRLTKDLKDEDEILKAYCRVRDEIREAMRMLPDLLGDP